VLTSSWTGVPNKVAGECIYILQIDETIKFLMSHTIVTVQFKAQNLES